MNAHETLVASVTVAMLIETLSDGCPATRCHAANRLGAFGPLAQPAVPALQTALDDSVSAAREAAFKALYRINGSRI